MKMWDKIRKPVIFTLLAVAAISYYVYLSHRPVDNTEKTNDKSAVATVISRDLSKNYPGSPQSVVTYYSDILTILYKENYTDEQFAGIVEHIRGLFDDELLERNGNDYDSYYTTLATEVSNYKDVGKYVSGYELESGYNFEHFTYHDDSYYRIDVKYLVMEGNNLVRTYEKFTLRKDENGNWKILYWTLSNADEMEK